MTALSPATRDSQAAALRILCRIALRQIQNEELPRVQAGAAAQSVGGGGCRNDGNKA